MPTGPVGVGKSHLAAALGHQACRRGHDVTFTTCSRLLAHLAGGHADRSFEARVRKLAKTTVLICDDFAMREFTAAQADDLYELLTERVGRPGRSLILTSNRHRRTGIRCSPTRSSASPSWTGSSTPATTCCWTARATVPGAVPARTGPPLQPRARHDQKVAASPPLTLTRAAAPRAGGRAAQGYGAAPPAKA